jgi:hypothetical protein
MEVDVFKRLQDYVGREYRAGVYDCAHLVADVQADLFGRSISLPSVHPMGSAGQRRVINAMRDELALEIAVPFPGCAALLSGRSNDGHEVLHIGTVALRHGEPWILHNSAHFGSAQLKRLSDLNSMGLSLKGWYAWK